MDWIRSHPYAISLAAAGILLIYGAIVVASHSQQTVAGGGVSTWNGTPVVLDVPSAQTYPTATRTPVATAPQNDTVSSSTLPYQPSKPEVVATKPVQNSTSAGPYDFGALVTQISTPSSGTKNPAATGPASSGINAWDYVPKTSISVTIPTHERTPAQEALFQYGNEIGSVIMGYDATHRDQISTIEASDKDRQNAAKSAAVAQIGTDLELVGQKIAQIKDVPASVQGRNDSLSASYIAIGKKLEDIAQAQSGSDTALVTAIKSYDASINAFNTEYVMMAQSFINEGVTFGAADPGSVFSFNASSL